MFGRGWTDQLVDLPLETFSAPLELFGDLIAQLAESLIG
jgi:hypothetical protein